MPSNSLEHLSSLFNEIDFKFQRADDRIFSTIDFDGTEAKLMVSLNSGGNVVNFELMGVIRMEEIRSSQHLSTFVEYLLKQNWTTACGSLEMDTDGEVRVVLELPMADAVMTANQMRLVISALANQAQLLLTKGLSILKTGKVEQPANTEQDDEHYSGQMGGVLVTFMRLSQSEEGRATLRGIEADADAPEALRALARKVLSLAAPSEL